MTILRNFSHLSRVYDATGTLISKRCITCKQQKAIGEFGQKTGTADGHINQCRLCRNTYLIANGYHKRRAQRRAAERADTPEAARSILDSGQMLWRCLHHIWPVRSAA